MFTLLGLAWVLFQNPDTRAKALIEARLARDTLKLLANEPHSQVEMDGLQCQWLLSLGQNGDPRALPELEKRFTGKATQAMALFAYGELDGAPTEPLWMLGDKLLPQNRRFWEEALSKLATEKDADRITEYWLSLNDTEKNQALFYFYRRPTEARTAAVIAWLDAKGPRHKPAAFLYLQRAAHKMEPDKLAHWLNHLQEDAASLFFALRVPARSGSPLLQKTLAKLCKHGDWRVRNFALNALANPALQADSKLILKVGKKALNDPNPNVVRAAVVATVKLKDAKVDAELARSKKLTPSQIQTLLANAAPEQRARFYPMVADWASSQDAWKRRSWAALAADQDASVIPQLKAMVAGEDPGLAGIALDSLSSWDAAFAAASARQMIAAHEDAISMANALTILSKLSKGKTFPLSLQTLDLLAQSSYPSIDFHQSYLSNPDELFDQAGLKARVEKLRSHPDYAVRLAAFHALPGGTLEQRAAIYASSWRHEVPAEIPLLAEKMILSKTQDIWVLKTAKGEVQIRLESQYAPLTCANIVSLSKKGIFDKMPFHRVVGNFVVQGGDPRGDGSGGPNYSIPCEINDLRFQRGTVGMALSGKDTGGSQFFICHAPQPHLDGGYTIFGQVISGMEKVDLLEEGDLILSSQVLHQP